MVQCFPNLKKSQARNRTSIISSRFKLNVNWQFDWNFDLLLTSFLVTCRFLRALKNYWIKIDVLTPQSPTSVEHSPPETGCESEDRSTTSNRINDLNLAVEKKTHNCKTIARRTLRFAQNLKPDGNENKITPPFVALCNENAYLWVESGFCNQVYNKKKRLMTNDFE